MNDDTTLKTILFGEEDCGKRFDKALSDALPEYSRSDIKRWIQSDRVYDTNGAPLKNPSGKITSPMSVVVDIEVQQDITLEKEAIDLDIVYEDEHLSVINKQAGIAVHPGAGINSGTIVHGLLHRYGAEGLAQDAGIERPGIVHRLDKDTTGLMLVARDNKTYHLLKNMLKNRDIHRTYQAVTWGTPSPREGTIHTLYGRHAKNRLKMAVQKDHGKEAITHYEVTKPLGLHNALVTCHLDTGRTHQIRVHMAHIGTPVMGDPVYCPQHPAHERRLDKHIRQQLKSLQRQALHAWRLSFLHPIHGKDMRFEAPLPKDIQSILECLENQPMP